MLAYFLNSVSWLTGGIGLGIMIKDWQRKRVLYVVYVDKSEIELLEKPIKGNKDT